MIEFHVESWTDLNYAIHSNELFPQLQIAGHHFRSPYIFRGMVNSKWGFETSLQRLNSPINIVEEALIRSFRKYATLGTLKNNSFWELLSIAQHNGLPTRCLDWSASPLIAAHFATDDDKYKEFNGVIWGVNMLIWKNHLLIEDLQNSLKIKPAWTFDIAMLDKIFPSLDSLNKLNAERDPDNLFIENRQVLIFEPPSIDQRIHNQFGILSASTDPEIDQLSYFLACDKLYPQLLVKITIEKNCKSKLRDMLDQNNINERMLFPGMPGLCQWLKRHYGPSVNYKNENTELL